MSAVPASGLGQIGPNTVDWPMRGTLNVVGALAALVAVGSVDVLAQAGRYPAARHGGNYMHNFYFPPAPSSTPWAPSWSPDGESIAVAMSGSIWQVDPATGVATELTYSPDAYHTSPDWSPDGRWIVYAADYDGDRVQLELLEVASGETRALTGDGHVYADPAFSPDGARIAYVSTRPSGYFNIAVRPVEEGRWAGDEMPVTADHAYPANRLYFGPWDMHITPGVAARGPREHGERRAAAGLEPGHPARLRQRPAGSRWRRAASGAR